MKSLIKNELKIAKEMLFGLKMPAIIFLRFLFGVTVFCSVILALGCSEFGWWGWIYVAFVFWVAERINWNEESSRHARIILQGKLKK